MAETLHGLDEIQTEHYIEMVGRLSALHLHYGNPPKLPDITTEMIKITRTPVIPGSGNILGETEASDVLSAFGRYLETGVDEAMEYLQTVARKL